MHLRRYLLLLLSGLAILHPAAASASEKVSGSSGLTDILFAAGIVAIVFIVFVFSIYVRHQRNSNALVLSHMYGTILEGRLQILVVNLQEFSEFLDIDAGEKRQENFLPDSFQDLGHVELRETLFELLEKNGLGNRERKNLQRGFDYLYEALVLIRSLPAGKVNVLRYVSQDDRLKLQYLLTRSIEAFETVRRRTIS